MATQSNQAGRPALLVVVLLAILLASVGAAWWVSESRGELVANGAGILERIRAEKLSNLWSPEPLHLYYLHRDPGGRAIGFHEVSRRGDADGFIGQTVVREREGDIQESWQVNDDARAGDYRSLASNGLHAAITLKDQVLTVRLASPPGMPKSAQAPAPDNYIPEGLYSLAIQMVAKRKAPARFQTIFDSLAVRGGRIRFVSLTMTPLSESTVVCRYDPPEGEPFERTVHLDSAGQIIKIDEPRGVLTLVTLDELKKAFPPASAAGAKAGREDAL